MATSATIRHDYVEARIFAHIATLTITGSPTLEHADVPRQGSVSTDPRLRVSFRPLDPRRRGKFSATQSALDMAQLVVIDLFFPGGDDGAAFNLHTPAQAAADLQADLQYLTLSFLDYTVPAAPVVVSDASIRITRPVSVRRLPITDGLRRHQVRATVEWIGRVDDSFA